jgi:hypothetical protein
MQSVPRNPRDTQHLVHENFGTAMQTLNSARTLMKLKKSIMTNRPSIIFSNTRNGLKMNFCIILANVSNTLIMSKTPDTKSTERRYSVSPRFRHACDGPLSLLTSSTNSLEQFADPLFQTLVFFGQAILECTKQCFRHEFHHSI